MAFEKGQYYISANQSQEELIKNVPAIHDYDKAPMLNYSLLLVLTFIPGIGSIICHGHSLFVCFFFAWGYTLRYT